MIRFVIWGAGEFGERITNNIGESRIEAFIDSDTAKWGKTHCNKIIISFEEYKEKYNNYCIIVALSKSSEVTDFLKKSGVYHFLELDDCPSEMRSADNVSITEKIPFTISLQDQIFGLSLYSLLVWEKMFVHGYKNGIRVNKVNKICKEICNRVEGLSITEICKTSGKIYRFTNEKIDNIIAKTEIVDVYNLMTLVPEYYNSRLLQFKDVNADKRVFIVCNGPSLKAEDLDKIYMNNDISFGMNGIFAIFNETKWRPDYYVSMDTNFQQSYEEEIKNIDVNCKFIANFYPPFWEDNIDDRIIRMHTQLVDYKRDDIRFSDSCEYGVYDCYTVTYVCMQLAAYMGIKKIYLLGCDCTFTKNENNEEDKNHFSKEYAKKLGNKKYGSFIEGHIAGYSYAKKYLENKGIKIYNATRGGKLEVFERVDFDSLF